MKPAALVLIAAVTLLQPGLAFGQDTKVRRLVERLPEKPTADHIVSLAAESQNAYVYFLQGELKTGGYYSGALTGQLTQRTISALANFCAANGIAEACAVGPLTPSAIRSVSNTLQSLRGTSAPATEEATETAAVEPAAEAAPEPDSNEISAIAPNQEPPALPAGWSIYAPDAQLGVEMHIQASADNGAQLRFIGTAARDGYMNLQLSNFVPGGIGLWETEVLVSAAAEAGTTPNLRLMTALFKGESYSGELDTVGTPIAADGETRTPRLDGSVTDEAVTALLPYVQLTVQAGEAVDVFVLIDSPSTRPAR